MPLSEPTPDNPLRGSCLCGGAGFEVTAPDQFAPWDELPDDGLPRHDEGHP
jgi:hypothetical protein